MREKGREHILEDRRRREKEKEKEKARKRAEEEELRRREKEERREKRKGPSSQSAGAKRRKQTHCGYYDVPVELSARGNSTYTAFREYLFDAEGPRFWERLPERPIHAFNHAYTEDWGKPEVDDEEDVARRERRRQQKERRWDEYTAAWKNILAPTQPAELRGRLPVPWPVESGKLADVERVAVEKFFLSAPVNEVGSGGHLFELLKTERVRWHPDKAQQR
ncbi:hypothetical protein RUND412_008411 [Rhizina undulata]